MKVRKLSVCVLALLLMISSLQLTAFAADGDAQVEKMSNMVFMAMPENYDCKEVETLKDVQAKLVLTKDADPAVTAELPLTYDKDLGGFTGDAYVEGESMQTIIADLTANQAKYDELLNFDNLDLDELFGDDEALVGGDTTLSKKQMAKKLSETVAEEAEEFDIFDGYTVTIEGLPEHYTPQHTGIVITGDLLLDVFDFVKKLMAEILEAPELENVQTVQEMLDEFAKVAEYESFEKMLADFELTDEEMAEFNNAIAEVEDIFNQAKAGTFESIFVDMAVLKCDCPVLEFFEIYHEYYKEVNGKRTLVKRVGENEDEWGFSNLTGESGSYIQAEDWMKCEYDGLTYDFVNSYNSWVMYDEEPNWEDDIVTEFKLGDYECTGLVLRYVHVEEEEVPVDMDADTDQDNEAAPQTGDHTQIGIYIALFVTAVVAVLVLLAYKKKKKSNQE